MTTERLRHDPAMRWIVGGKTAQSSAASPSQMGRFETQWLAAPKNFAALAHLSGQCTAEGHPVASCSTWIQIRTLGPLIAVALAGSSLSAETAPTPHSK